MRLAHRTKTPEVLGRIQPQQLSQKTMDIKDRSTLSAHEIESSVNVAGLRNKIVESGILGRSPRYTNLLDYLLDCAQRGKQPKEFEIAIDVLKRDSNFDVARDSIVRVHIHQLRKRLDSYFASIDPAAPYRLEIPKGQYRLISVPAHKPAPISDASVIAPEKPASNGQTLVLMTTIALLLIIILLQWLNSREHVTTNEHSAVLSNPIWNAVIDNDLPILIVMGDYYIFGELDSAGRVSRMVRDFMVNSRQDLGNLFLMDAELQRHYRDLDMTYLPEGSASALAQIAPLINATGKGVNITMMSRLNTADLRSNHIVYIGYISALDKLNNLYFTASGLIPGQSFDELYNKETGVLYTSNAGLPEQGQPFRDIALLASWEAAQGNQFIIIGGTRDAGLMQAAAIASSAQQLDDLSMSLGPDIPADSFEALYEVYGIDRMNFDSSILYRRHFESDQIWTATPLP